MGDALPAGSPRGRTGAPDAAVDPTTAFRDDEAAAVLELAHRLAARGHDVNLVLSGPACVGVDQLAEELARRSPGFRFAGSRNPQTTPAQTLLTMDACNAQRRECLGALASGIARRGGAPVSTPRAVRTARRIDPPEDAGGELLGMSASQPLLSTPRRPLVATASETMHQDARPPEDLSAIALTLHTLELRRSVACLRASARGAGRRAAPGPRMRVFGHSILDATRVAELANRELPLLGPWALMALEALGDTHWGEFTAACPAHSTLYVYLYFEERTYAAICDAYRSKRAPEDRAEFDNLRAFWMAQKRAADTLYHSGTDPSVVGAYYVLCVNCHNVELTNPCTQLFIIRQILQTVDALQTREGAPLWGAHALEADRKAFLCSTAWMRQRFAVVPAALVLANQPWRVPGGTRRLSLDEPRPAHCRVEPTRRRSLDEPRVDASASGSSIGANTRAGGSDTGDRERPRIGGGITPLAKLQLVRTDGHGE